ncbi:MAG: hypothetical protein WBA57_03775 [Elainellaceae cyanobacterium]
MDTRSADPAGGTGSMRKFNVQQQFSFWRQAKFAPFWFSVIPN